MPASESGMGPLDDDVHAWSEGERARLASVPASLEEAGAALEPDPERLLEGGDFDEEPIRSASLQKTRTVIAVRNRPHPFEMNLYRSA